MGTIDVNQESLRSCGATLEELASNFQLTVGSDVSLTGQGDHSMISSGKFAQGGEAQNIYNKAVTLQGQNDPNIALSFRSLSSAVYGMADLFGVTDLENGFRFMFGDPRADKPAYLPPHIVPEETMMGGSDEANEEYSEAFNDELEKFDPEQFEGSGNEENTVILRDSSGRVIGIDYQTINEETGSVAHEVHNYQDDTVHYYRRAEDGETTGHFTVSTDGHAMSMDDVFDELNEEVEEARDEIGSND
ncbi:hypothetical protein SAMN05216266_11095 [Amycolatopsis marina]|uniref:Uncharacterized protein n=1 Tax=Amycolatopsis marina TaxID=490629 RepID=A0A1I1AW17_9PSEU|nr:hypothetical protein [Amycolatopsis marina]SFB40628.1 hypothetical protein SAMN05216266_11095 [Amycolatopsis marina]